MAGEKICPPCLERRWCDRMKYLMGIDMGGTVVKTAIFDLEGREVAVYGEKLSILYPGHGMTERNMEEAREKIYKSIAGALKKGEISGEEIAAIGVTGQGNGAYMFDAQGQPTWNAVMSSDARAKNFIKKWYQKETFDQIYKITRQQIWSGNISAIIAWFKKEHPEVLEKTKYIVTAKDYIRYLLTGVFCTELTEGSGMSCMDIEKQTYSEELFRILGIEEYLEKIPKAIGSCEIGGRVTVECGRITGLKPGTPVVGGLFDVCASIVSAGVVEEDQMSIIVGSWGINTVLKKELAEDQNLFMQYLYCIPDCYAFMEGSSTSASNQEWFIDSFMERTPDVYQKCNEMVESTFYKDTVLFLPFIYGTNVNIDAKAIFVGLQGEHEKAHMLRALYEGVVFCHKMHIERLLKHTQMPPSIRMAGGAARSSVWMQMFADILGTEVQVSEASELGAMGAALCAGVGIQLFDSMEGAARKWVKIKQTYKPDREKHEYYLKKYAVYKKILTAMDSVWEGMEQLK